MHVHVLCAAAVLNAFASELRSLLIDHVVAWQLAADEAEDPRLPSYYPPTCTHSTALRAGPLQVWCGVVGMYPTA